MVAVTGGHFCSYTLLPMPLSNLPIEVFCVDNFSRPFLEHLYTGVPGWVLAIVHSGAAAGGYKTQ